MFVVTADQVDSRQSRDLVADALEEIAGLPGLDLLRPAERTAGDELQAATGDGGSALDIVLHLTASERWSVGLGIGDVRQPLPETTRAMAGSAFVAARAAVEAAKRRPTRFAVVVDPGRAIREGTVQPLVDLLLALRQRRTPEGWELYALLRTGMTQKEAAERLGITPQAASLRAIAGGLRLDDEARTALTGLLALADERIAS